MLSGWQRSQRLTRTHHPQCPNVRSDLGSLRSNEHFGSNSKFLDGKNPCTLNYFRKLFCIFATQVCTDPYPVNPCQVCVSAYDFIVVLYGCRMHLQPKTRETIINMAIRIRNSDLENLHRFSHKKTRKLLAFL